MTKRIDFVVPEVFAQKRLTDELCQCVFRNCIFIFWNREVLLKANNISIDCIFNFLFCIQYKVDNIRAK
jgi:hypothetical protein